MAAPGGFVGAVAPTFWRCDEHADVPLTVPWSGRRPLIGQTRENCSWSRSRIGDSRIEECGCGTHIGEVRQ